MTELTGGDKLSEMIKEGWNVAGYSVCMMAMGALAHNILLQKAESLMSLTVVTNKDDELGRSTHLLAPSGPPKKKGFWG